MDLAALQKKAAASSHMGGSAPILHGRVIYFDGDGLAYYCAGNDDTSIAEARERLRDKVESMQRVSSAEKRVILLTASGSHKGHRYALARVKPYQGQRTNAKRPKNWRALRELLDTGEFGETISYTDREADDGFGYYGWLNPQNTVIATQDKDMRMVPGWHMDWKDNRMFYLAPDQFEASWNDKVYGEKWFWLQMLQGDTADNIPGLPLLNGKKCGEITAAKYLAPAGNREEALTLVAAGYRGTYGDRWYTEMAEQACLLWMRAGKDADWFEACSSAGPLFLPHDDYDDTSTHHAAWLELTARVKQAQDINDLQTQDN
jgi:DNA polymerase-1